MNQNLALYFSLALYYENFDIIGDFNVEADDVAISIFSDTCDLKSSK